ncbi:DUF4091 domain-containing protein [Candidatus Calescamantes bacterium]|nr:DUF4091 domain-containing protein [Candidatus Calescamantes bacterium]
MVKQNLRRLILIFVITIPLGKVAWGEVVQDVDGSLSLRNGLVKIELNRKQNYRLMNFSFDKGSIGARCNLSFAVKEKGEKPIWEYDSRIKSEVPEIKEGDGKTICIVNQHYPDFEIKKTVEFFEDKPYFHLKITAKPLTDVDTDTILLGINSESDNSNMDMLAYRTTGGQIKEYPKPFDLKKNKWINIRANFLAHQWIAVYSKETGEGFCVLFPYPHCWHNFSGAPVFGVMLKEKGYGINFNHPLGWKKRLSAGTEIILEAYVLAFKGDPGKIAETILKEIKNNRKKEASLENIMVCPRIANSPVIDGKLDDICWDNALKLTGFSMPYGGLAKHQTTAFLCYDNKNLYIAFRCEEPKMDKIVAKAKKNDSKDIFGDDEIEIFIGFAKDYKQYFHFVVNPLGTRWDASVYAPGTGLPIRLNTDWNPSWDVKTSLRTKEWIAEMALPWESLGKVPSAGDIWRLNLNRNRRAKGGDEQRELSCWSATMGGFHKPEQFGKVIFGDKESIRLEDIQIGEMDKRYELKATIDNNTERDRKIKVQVKIISTLSLMTSSNNSSIIKLGPYTKKQINLKYKIKKGQKQTLLFSLLDPETNKVYYKKVYYLLSTGGERDLSPQVLAKTEDFLVWLETSTRKVFKDDLVKFSITNNTIHISAAKNEYEPFQIVVRPYQPKEMKNIKLEFSDLVREDGLYRIDKKNIKYNPVGYVNIKIPSDAFSRLGLWPDPLLEDKTFNADKPENYPVWVTVYIPKDTPSGNYKGNIKLISDTFSPISINLDLKVYDFTLPDQTYLKTVMYLWPRYGDAWNGKQYIDNITQHKMGAMNIVPGPKIEIRNGNLKVDFTPFDEIATYCIEKCKWRTFRIPFSCRGHGSKLVPFCGYEYGTPEFTKYYSQYLQLMYEHLKKKGWLDKAYYYVWDEPVTETDLACMREFVKMVKEIMPGVKIYAAVYQTPEKVNAPIDIYWTHFRHITQIMKKCYQKNTPEIWLVFNGGSRYPYPALFIDHPAINVRIIPWICWKYGFTGIGTWAINCWRTNPWVNPNSYLNYNGEGMLLYPDPEGQRRPINSIRWELLREGVEDYDYLYILKQKLNLLEELIKKGKENKYNSLLKKARGILASPNTFIESFSQYTKNPDVIYNARENIAQSIEEINKAIESLEQGQMVVKTKGGEG